MLKRFLVAAAAAVAFTAGGSVAAFASTSYQPDNYSHNVVNDKSGKCMDNTGFNWVNGNPVQQWTCGADGGVDQNLRLVNTDGYEALAFVQPGTDTSWYVTENGFRSQLTISDVPDESTQALTETNGVFTFTTSGLVADDRGQSVRNGAQVIGYTYNGGANQVWTQLADNHFQHHPKPGPVPTPTPGSSNGLSATEMATDVVNGQGPVNDTMGTLVRVTNDNSTAASVTVSDAATISGTVTLTQGDDGPSPLNDVPAGCVYNVSGSDTTVDVQSPGPPASAFAATATQNVVNGTPLTFTTSPVTADSSSPDVTWTNANTTVSTDVSGCPTVTASDLEDLTDADVTNVNLTVTETPTVVSGTTVVPVSPSSFPEVFTG